jgi:hypothetical protein
MRSPGRVTDPLESERILGGYVMKKFKMLPINLRMFDGPEGAAPAAPGATTTDTTVKPGGSHPAVKGETVVYGKQPEPKPNEGDKGTAKGQAAIDQKPTTPTPEERKAQFEKLISEEYKDLYTEKTQTIIDKRFSETKNLEKQFGVLQPALEILMDKYNVKDPSKLTDAIMNDVDFLEELAEKAGMTVEQFKQARKLQSENEQLSLKVKTIEAQQKMDEQVSAWYKQADELIGTKEKPGPYPEFDLKKESLNQDFVSLLKSGVNVKAAYEVVHMDDIKNNIAKTTAKTVENNVTANIQAKGMRPAENGVNNNSGVVVKNDVKQLTKEDRAEIARRAQSGQAITF